MGSSPPPGFLGLAEVTAQQEQLRKQLEHVRALRGQQGPQFETWGGNLASALGNIGAGIIGGVREGSLADALAANQKAEQGKLGEFNTELVRPDATPEDQERLALQAIASGHPALAATGTASLTHSDRKLARTLQEEERKKAAERARIDDERAQKALELNAERFQWDKDHPQTQYVVGPGNQIFGAPSRVLTGTAPTATPATITTTPPAGPALIKPTDLSDSEKKGMEDLSETIRNSTHLLDTFKDEFAGLGGKLSTVVGETLGDVGLGDLASAPAKAATAWWSEYDQFLKLPERLRVSGQSLTASEERSFERASRARKGGDPKLIREALQDMMEIAARKQDARAKSATARGVSPDVLNPLLETPPAPTLDTSTPVSEPPAPPSPRPAVLKRSVGPHGPTVMQDGVEYRWNPKTGEYE